MNDYRYERRYHGILVMSHFKMTDQLCHDYVDAYFADLDNPSGITQLAIDDPAPYPQQLDDDLGDAIMKAKTVEDVIKALQMLPGKMPFAQGYGYLYLTHEQSGDDLVRHVHTELFNNE